MGRGNGRWPPVDQSEPPASPSDESPVEELAADDEAAGADEADNDPAVVAGPAGFAGSGVAALVEGSGVAAADNSESPAGADDTCWICVGVSIDVT